MTIPKFAQLVLENGSIYSGYSFGAQGETVGEIVFSTGMTGYQETITDPSYAGQIVVQTSPHIGIVGMNQRDEESDRIWVAGYVVMEPSRIVSNHRAEQSLPEQLVSQGVVGISGIDTRALTLEIRESGAMRAGIFTETNLDKNEMLSRVMQTPEMLGRSLSNLVTTSSVKYFEPEQGQEVLATVAILDLGIKRSTIDHMLQRGLRLELHPAGTTAEEFLSGNPDGVFFSNGPGDPASSAAQIALLQEVLDRGLPFFGICFGNQLLGRALGFETYKLPFGHRGINQPVLDTETGRVEVTAHNHGFAVRLEADSADSPLGYGLVKVSHRGLNDGVVEGLECVDRPAFSVQYHPEAAAGPHDSHYLFDRFVALLRSK